MMRLVPVFASSLAVFSSPTYLPIHLSVFVHGSTVDEAVGDDCFAVEVCDGSFACDVFCLVGFGTVFVDTEFGDV